VHVIDGCFLHLTDLLEPEGQLYYHRYARSYACGLKDFALRHGWSVHAYGADWDMRLAKESKEVALTEGQSLFTKTAIGRTLSRTPEGWWILEGDPHGSASTLEKHRLDWDRPMLAALGKYIRPGSAVLDVGAHIGSHTIFYLEAVGPEGMVFAFEPYLPAFTCLRRNCPEAKCFAFAIGERDGFCDLQLNPESRAMNRIVDEESGPYQMRRLDTLRDDLGYLPGGISLIKIDVEGYELRVLEGAKRLIEEFRPALCLEINEPFLKEAGTSPPEIFRFLTRLHYNVSKLEEGWSDIIGIPV
jgi:FkbM family methyltransferase